MSFFDAVATDDITLHGLEKWTCHMFEQLGWMTLAYKSKSYLKVSSYITSINKLNDSIENRLKIIISEDAKIDLTNLLTKVKHLKKVTQGLFDMDKLKKDVCEKCNLPSKNKEELSEETNENKLNGGAKSRKIKLNKLSSSKSKIIKSNQLMKKLSKTSSKKGSKISSKKSYKTSKIQDQPLIKKLSKKSSKKTSNKMKNKIFKKL
jgi:hypothetical protein